MSFQGSALELLPAHERLEQAREDAESSHRQASSKKALASARDLLDVALRERSKTAEARAHLLMGIALRRSGDRNAARDEYSACDAILAKLLNAKSAALKKEAAEIQIDLHLEEAIDLFLERDFIESARKNERAAKLAAAISKTPLACRAWLNAAVSWDRASDLREARACLERGQSLLPTLSASALETSYLLFAWKMGIDNGPLALPADLPSQSSLSQKTLYLLYGWEHALITSSMNQSEAARTKLLTHLNAINESQFATEIQELSALADRFHSGKGKSPSTSECLTESASALKIAIGLSDLFLQGSWKKLEMHASLAARNPHPAIQVWGFRAQAWTFARQRRLDDAQATQKQALEVARTQGMEQLALCIELELGSRAEGDVSLSIQERRIFSKWSTIAPARQNQLLLCTKDERSSVSSVKAISMMDEALRGKGPYAQAFLVDGVRQLVRLPVTKNKSAAEVLQIEKLVVQKKLLFSLIVAYPASVSKEDLVSRVWDELYNPLVHDAVLYRTVSRLRKLLRGGWITFESGALKLTPGTRPFLAALPSDESLLRQSPLDERKIRILTLIKYRGRITRAEAVKALQEPERTIARDLTFLVERKLVARQGAGRGTVYVPVV